MLAAVVAGPVAGCAPFRERRAARIVGEERREALAHGRASPQALADEALDVDADLDYVFAKELDNERDDAGVFRREDPGCELLTNESIVVTGVNAGQNERVLVVEPFEERLLGPGVIHPVGDRYRFGR